MDTPQLQTAMSNSGSSEAGAQHQEPLPLPARARSEITTAQEISAIPQGDKVDLLGARREEILQTKALIAKEKKEALLYNLMIANDKAKDFGDAMIASDLEAIENSDGMFVLRDIPALELMGYKKVSIVVRKVTQEFWQRCIDRADATDEDCRVVVLGTPGIGKTTSTPLLIRHLLKRGTTVVYHVRTRQDLGWFYRFVPIVDDSRQVVGVKSTAIEESHTVSAIMELCSRSTYYIVDPGDDSSYPQPGFEPRVIIVASPDSRHWHRVAKGRGPEPASAAILTFPLWTEEELISAVNFLSPGMKPDEVNARFRLFGGVPRHIMLTKGK
jgi:hypothetical protein